jgi:hypothetical protein
MNQSEIPLIPEFIATSGAMNDIALRTQQILIALQLYENTLINIDSMLPGLRIEGYDLKEIPIFWNSNVKNPDELAANIKKSTTLVLLSALNLHIYLLDLYMIEILKKHYNIHEDIKTIMTPEIFMETTKIDLTKLPNSDNIDDVRRVISGLRDMKKTHSITVPEYFEYYQNLIRYMHSIANIVSEKIFNDNKVKGNENV